MEVSVDPAMIKGKACPAEHSHPDNPPFAYHISGVGLTVSRHPDEAQSITRRIHAALHKPNHLDQAQPCKGCPGNKDQLKEITTPHKLHSLPGGSLLIYSPDQFQSRAMHFSELISADEAGLSPQPAGQILKLDFALIRCASSDESGHVFFVGRESGDTNDDNNDFGRVEHRRLRTEAMRKR